MSDLLTVEALTLSRGARLVLRDLALSVRAGEICALMGRSGAGKSTVLRVAAALEPFEAGRIDVGGFALDPGPVPPESRLAPLRRRLGMVFQGYALFDHLTVLENVVLAPIHALRRPRAEAEGRGRELLESLGVGARASAYPREISGGEAQRVAIARALATDPRILLMDEPTAALDPARRASLGEILRRVAGEGRGLLVATHDTSFARAHADRVVVLADGVVVEAGPARAVLDAPRHSATRALLAGDAAEAGER